MCLEVFLVPNDARVSVRIRIVKIRNGASRATVETIEFGTNFVFRTGADRVACLALLEHIRALFDILRQACPRRCGNQHWWLRSTFS